MRKIDFYKNKNKVPINKDSIEFDFNNVIIYKKEIDYTIKLDFKNKLCSLNLIGFNKDFEIEVFKMNYYNNNNIWNLSYEISTEENILNEIVIEI